MNSVIENLLERAAVNDSSEDAMSSVARAERRFGGEPEAEKCFGELTGKLLLVEEWNAYGILSSFELFDETGRARGRDSAKVGNVIKISLAGSGKSDWLKIANLEYAPDETVLTVQPSYNPTETQPDKNVTSHFFTDESTNNFCLQRRGRAVNFYVIGLDEQANTTDTNNIIETARNIAAANLGHYFGIQKGEWTSFCKKFLESAPGK